MPPDYADLSCAIRVSRATKAQALGASASALEALTGSLRSLGGSVFTVDTADAPLTWSADSAETWQDHSIDSDPALAEGDGGRPRALRVMSAVSMTIVLRDLDRMGALGRALAAHPDVHVHGVRWRVDEDNASWSEVRAAAIRAAIRRGRDYASALGGSLARVEHIADSGMLADAATSRWVAQSESGSSARYDAGDTPSLDPVPQELRASVDARFIATVEPIGEP